ncbi:MAG: hypothetical protein LUH15_00525 [Tannerellaceae bacterium]|nr:hypothetical protein [Tannerellaceae bacterium]
MQAKYLLLHGAGQLQTTLIFRLGDEGPRIIPKEDMEKKNYPAQNGKIAPFYIGYTLQSKEPINAEFGGRAWDVTNLTDQKKLTRN